MNGEELAIQLTYLVAGVQQILDLHRVTTRLTGAEDSHPITESDGHIGMVTDLLPYAQRIVKSVGETSPRTFPSVFEYEVTEQLGRWLAEHWAEGMTITKFNNELNERITKFLAS